MKLGFIEFLGALNANGYRRIYIAHYDDATPARKLGFRLEKHGFKVTIAEDARPRGPEFVNRKIGESDLLIVVNPGKSEENFILKIGSEIYDLEL